MVGILYDYICAIAGSGDRFDCLVDVDVGVDVRHTSSCYACCEDETVIHEGTDFKGSIEHIHIDVPAPTDIEQPVVLISEVIPASPIARTQYYNYDPPLRSCDLTVEHQVFLI